MRFNVPDSDSDEGYNSLASSMASEDFDMSIEEDTRGPRSMLGQNIRTHLESSDSEPEVDSEDEVGLVLDEKPEEPPKTSFNTFRNPPHAESSKAPWRRQPSRDMLEARAGPGGYDEWLKQTEAQVMTSARQLAKDRRMSLRDAQTTARADVSTAHAQRQARDEASMLKMLQGIAIGDKADKAATQKRFEERQKRLWEDINEAIRQVEKKEAEQAAAAAAAVRKKQEEEAARVAAEEKAALARRAEAERLAKDHIAKQQAEKEARAVEEKRQSDAKAKAIEADTKVHRTRTECRYWVDKQKMIKKEVVEPVKGDRALRMALKQGMRLMTRGLGQVVNTRESVLRVTNDLHSILCEQLPSAPSTSSATTLAPIAYSYLLSHLSKALIRQAESEVSAKSEAGFPLARVVLGLLLRGHAALGEVLFARLVKKCPWVIPHYPVRQKDQPREEYEKSTGRGTDESLADYIARMVGITTLYFAIIQTSLSSLVPSLPASPTPDQLSTLIVPPLRAPAAWSWLAQILRDPLASSPPVASMITSWIDIIGAEAIRTWGRGQMNKVFQVIADGAQGRIKGDSEAARQKLGLVLESIGSIEYPKGRDWE